MIDKDSELKELCERLESVETLAIDTEFVWTHTYHPRPALVQIADLKSSYLIDVIALKDLSPLGRVLANPNVTKVFHSCVQDLHLLQQLTGELPEPLYDSQIAAAALGQSYQISYSDMVEHNLGVKLDKKVQFSDWCQRPLPPEWLHYARNDVKHLIQCYYIQKEALIERKRLHWLEDDCKRLVEQVHDKIYNPEPPYKQLRSWDRLKPQSLNILKRLALWRETKAREINRRPRRILQDNVLMDIVFNQPTNAEELGRIKGIPRTTLSRNQRDILKAVDRGLEDKALESGSGDRKRLRSWQKQLVKDFQEQTARIGRNNQINSSYLASRADFRKMIFAFEKQQDPSNLRLCQRELLLDCLRELYSEAASSLPPGQSR